MIAHAFLTAMFLLSGQWIALLLNAPLVAFNVNKCVSLPFSRFCERESPAWPLSTFADCELHLNLS